MIHKMPSPIPNHVRVIFVLPSSIWADHIALVGDFNRWDAHATPMQQDREGVWRAAVDLPYGSQGEFRYLVDGQWKTDYHADGLTSNAYGSDNSVVGASLPEDALVVKRSQSQVLT